MNFNYYIPTRILFGSGKFKELATTSLPGKKALIVITAGTSMKKFGYLEKTIEYLKQNNVESVVFDKILPNPIEEHVMEGAQLAKDENCDFVIGLGGGSSIDSAKSIAIMAKNEGKYWDYIKGKAVSSGVLPIVAIPTTAGTGTEADPWTVITNTELNEKVGYGIDQTFPVLSIVDPNLMLSIPPKLTAFQGMDAFFHSVEGYLAKISQPVSDLYSLNSIELITKYLPVATKDGSNLEAREKLAWASTQSGMVESTSCCISQHSMEHALSGYHPELPHGAGLVLLSVSYFSKMLELTKDLKHIQDRFVDMAKAMGEDVLAVSENERPSLFIKALKKLIANIGLENLKLGDYGVEKCEAGKFAKNAMECMGFLFQLDPCTLTQDDVVSIYENCVY